MEKKFTRVKDYKFSKTLEEFLNTFLKTYENNTSIEGFVLRFPDGYLLKAKLTEYKRLHRLLTGLNEKDIWEALKEGKFEAMLEDIPDEMFGYVESVRADLQAKFDEIKLDAMQNMKDLGSRKDNALYYQTCNYPSVMFYLLDGKPVDEMVWKMVRPKVTKTYKIVSEDSN